MPKNVASKRTIAIVGTLDTKGLEVDYLRRKIEEQGCFATVIDVGVLGDPVVDAHYSRRHIAELGGEKVEKLIESAKKGADRAIATEVMITGASCLVKKLYQENKLHGIVSLGGSTGSAIGISAMKNLPIGVPKLMVGTHMAYSQNAGEKDITFMQTPADIIGLNGTIKRSLSQAAGSIVGMVKIEIEQTGSEINPMVAITSLGVTTPAVMKIKSGLEEGGEEVVVFHNRTLVLEELLQNGAIKGIIDLSPAELVWAFIAHVSIERKARLDLLGTIPNRLIIVPGSVDMIIVRHHEGETAEKYKGRITVRHGPYITLVRTNLEECKNMAKVFAQKANAVRGPVAILIPMEGFSAVDKEGQPFHNPNITKAFSETVKKYAKKRVRVIEVQSHINDPKFAERVCRIFGEMKGA